MKKKILFLILILLVIPSVYAFSLLDILNEGIESITGRSAVTVSITAANDAPNITYVSMDAQSYSPLAGGVRQIEAYFLANDSQGFSNLINTSAKLNITLSGTSYNYENTSCLNAYDEASTLIEYNCTVEMQYWWDDSTSWSVVAEINDSQGNYIQNTTGTFTYNVATGFNCSTSLAWDSVSPLQTNQTSTTNMTLQNTGNRNTLNVTTTIINLYDSDGIYYIPASNFSVFNDTASDTECESTNQSASVTAGVNPIVGANATAQYVLFDALPKAQYIPESLYYCLFDVPENLTSNAYDTTWAGSWDITAGV